jgi:serine/threonine protein phosphatase PrpC
MRVRAWCDSRIGGREKNEDCYGIADDLGLFVVADGMGGYVGGEVASRLAVRTIDDCFHELADGVGPSAWERMDLAFRQANEEVRCARIDDLEEMGSTLSALVIGEREAVIGHLGDSRVYLLRRGELRRITSDHTVVESLKAAGVTSAGIHSAFSHMITKAIGVNQETEADLHCIEIEAGDRFLLCTDGLTDVVDDEVIAEILASGPAWAACRELTEEALRRGAADNVTALVVEVKAEGHDSLTPRSSNDPAHSAPIA